MIYRNRTVLTRQQRGKTWGHSRDLHEPLHPRGGTRLLLALRVERTENRVRQVSIQGKPGVRTIAPEFDAQTSDLQKQSAHLLHLPPSFTPSSVPPYLLALALQIHGGNVARTLWAKHVLEDSPVPPLDDRTAEWQNERPVMSTLRLPSTPPRPSLPGSPVTL